MHKTIYQEFEKICSKANITGSVLEVGAVPSPQSLLCMKALRNVKEKIGLNLDEPREYKDIKIVRGNANSMDCFEDEKFDAVLCNAVLEHDKFFWKSISEIKRVTKSGGLIVIGVPGYTTLKLEEIKKLNFIKKLRAIECLNMFFTSTITHQVHFGPGDYYRFSIQAVEEVLFDGLADVEIKTLMLPPRIIGKGIKK